MINRGDDDLRHDIKQAAECSLSSNIDSSTGSMDSSDNIAEDASNSDCELVSESEVGTNNKDKDKAKAKDKPKPRPKPKQKQKHKDSKVKRTTDETVDELAENIRDWRFNGSE